MGSISRAASRIATVVDGIIAIALIFFELSLPRGEASKYLDTLTCVHSFGILRVLLGNEAVSILNGV